MLSHGLGSVESVSCNVYYAAESETAGGERREPRREYMCEMDISAVAVMSERRAAATVLRALQ